MFGPTVFFLIFYLILVNPYLIAVCVASAGLFSSIYPSVSIEAHARTYTPILVMPPRDRPSKFNHVDFTAAQAAEFLQVFVDTDVGPTALFPYSKGKSGDIKKTINWNDLKRISLWMASPQPSIPQTKKLKGAIHKYDIYIYIKYEKESYNTKKKTWRSLL